MSNVCYLVIPCYNEEVVLPKTATILLEKYNSLIKQGYISEKSKIVLVDNGSFDNTWNIISDLHNKYPYFIGLKLTINCGYQNGILSGLMFAKNRCDFAISLDADLQDDINVFEQFIKKYQEGYHIVYGVRKKRTTDTWLKRNTALLFYNLIHLLGAKTIKNHAEFRLMSKEALEVLSTFSEINLFLRGVIPLMGFKSSIVEYNRKERLAGNSKFPCWQLLSFAIDGLTSVTISPIKFISVFGILISCISSFIFLIFIFVKIFGNIPIPGYASLICSIWLLGGIQLLSIGVIGEYVGKTYLETKHRPRYIIEKTLE